MGETVGMARQGAAVVRWYVRGNGVVAIAWREGGKQRRTSRTTWENAEEFGKRKARELDRAAGMQWVTPARAERLELLERLAGGAEAAGRMLHEVERALEALGAETAADLPPGRLAEAARWFMEHGPAVPGKRTLRTAVDGFLEEYARHVERTTWRPVRVELVSLAHGPRGAMELLEVSPALLDDHVRRGTPTRRTIRNRMAAWALFFRRARGHGWWPKGRDLPTALFRRPKDEERAPEVYTPREAARVLVAVRRGCPRFLPFVVLAGWCGLRPSEAVRLRWEDVDFTGGLLHVRPEVARKVRRERWVPVEPEVLRVLAWCRRQAAHGGAAAGMVCRRNSREHVSRFLRESGALARWIDDGWRHSFITCRLQVAENVDRVAEEAGNSPREIRRSYKRPVRPGTGARWWRVMRLFAGRLE